MRSMPLVLSLFLAGAVFGASTQDAFAQSAVERQQMREEFLKRADRYADLHRHIDLLLPPERVTADVEELFCRRAAIAWELRLARRGLTQGNIFASDIAVYFRVLIAESLRHDVLAFIVMPDEDDPWRPLKPVVNADYPAGAAINFMPPTLLRALPPLPPELQYSFLGRDLILWDVHAGLIVDFVPSAIPILTRP